MRIDLHVHSNASDGTDAPGEVIRRAQAAGLDVLALTDHDTTTGWDEAREAADQHGITLVTGMELSCQLADPKPAGSQSADSQLAEPQPADAQLAGPQSADPRRATRSIHVLAYLFDPRHEELRRETSLIRDDRTHRARQMVAKLNELGAPVTWEQVTSIAGDAVVGRPHIARALAAAGVVETPADAFTKEWIDDGGRAYVDRYALPAHRALALIRAAGGVAVLAHPRSPGYEVSNEEITALASAGLAGIEVFHPDHNPDTERLVLTALAHALDLIPTGGSDDHGSFNNNGLGSELTPRESYERILALTGVEDG